MKTVILIFAIATLVTGLIAAWYWYQSSKIPIKSTQPNAKSFDKAALGLAAGAREAIQKTVSIPGPQEFFTAQLRHHLPDTLVADRFS
jgi:hypothetical protein